MMGWFRGGLAAGAVFFVAAGACLSVVGCSSTPERPKRPTRTPVVRDLPAVLMGTVGAEVTVRGLDEALVTGYGLVVDLNGTGSGDAPQSVRAQLEEDMRRMGVGTELAGRLKDVTPGELIDDPNTAVVLVQALVPPGAPKGTKFDVRVSALPGSATTSLDGGLLYTTDLRPGVANPTGPDVQAIARARGPIFLNPFAEADASDVTRGEVVGRILDGGEITTPKPISIQLDNPSHSRAREIVRAINTAFPRVGREDVARGVSDELIELTIPPQFRDRTDEFVKLVQFTRIDQTFKEDWAQRYADTLVDRPELSEDMTWCLKALGPVAIPFARPLYDHAEIRPRMAAIEAGAYLGDALVRDHLETVIATGSPAARANAVRLMARLPVDGRVNRFLRETLSNEDLELRVAAYEALEQLNDPTIRRRRLGEKFELHTAPSSYPMVYVTQQGSPRVVVFGDGVELLRPLFINGWNGRLLINAESSSGTVSTMYRNTKGETVRAEVEPDLLRVIELMAHTPSPESPAPGFDLSYSQVVGALRTIVDAGGVDADFQTETDALSLALARSVVDAPVEDRPELSSAGAVDEVVPPDPDLATGEDDSATPPTTPANNYVVPLPTTPTPTLKDKKPS